MMMVNEKNEYDKAYYIILNHIMRETDNGMDLQTSVWHGYTARNKIAYRTIPQETAVPLERVRLIACHNAFEMKRKARILPGLYSRAKQINNI